MSTLAQPEPALIPPALDLDDEAGPLEEPAGDWFVNRQRQLDIFWKWGNNIPSAGRNSLALIGLRRTGKTAILHKTFSFGLSWEGVQEEIDVIGIVVAYLHFPSSARPACNYFI